jgi:hypothetical protein
VVINGTNDQILVSLPRQARWREGVIRALVARRACFRFAERERELERLSDLEPEHKS